MLLKPNMVIAGLKCPSQAGPAQVAEATVRCLKRYVPAAVPGIVFLSGGQSPEEATANLSAMNAVDPQPWQLSFSYGRALQAPVLEAWKGRDDNVAKAQEVFFKRCRLNGLAREGTYTRSMECD
jgi:fructose-bisphosphate aldolase class I